MNSCLSVSSRNHALHVIYKHEHRNYVHDFFTRILAKYRYSKTLFQETSYVHTRTHILWPTCI